MKKKTLNAQRSTLNMEWTLKLDVGRWALGVGRCLSFFLIVHSLDAQEAFSGYGPPTSVPVEWRVRVFRLDRVRAPVEIRHK